MIDENQEPEDDIVLDMDESVDADAVTLEDEVKEDDTPEDNLLDNSDPEPEKVDIKEIVRNAIDAHYEGNKNDPKLQELEKEIVSLRNEKIAEEEEKRNFAAQESKQLLAEMSKLDRDLTPEESAKVGARLAANLEIVSRTAKPVPKQEPKNDEAPKQNAGVDPFVQFEKDNPEFWSDPVTYGKMFEISRRLNGEGYDSNQEPNAYLRELKKRLNASVKATKPTITPTGNPKGSASSSTNASVSGTKFHYKVPQSAKDFAKAAEFTAEETTKYYRSLAEDARTAAALK